MINPFWSRPGGLMSHHRDGLVGKELELKGMAVDLLGAWSDSGSEAVRDGVCVIDNPIESCLGASEEKELSGGKRQNKGGG